MEDDVLAIVEYSELLVILTQRSDAEIAIDGIHRLMYETKATARISKDNGKHCAKSQYRNLGACAAHLRAPVGTSQRPLAEPPMSRPFSFAPLPSFAN